MTKKKYVDVLVAMPWMKHDHISIQLGLLQSYLSTNGINITTRHYYKDILSYIPEDIYYKIYYSNKGEYLSLSLLFPNLKDDILNNLNKTLPDVDFDFVINKYVEFMDDVYKDLITIQPRTIGFTTSLFQTISSFVIAQKLKTWNHEILNILGGASLTYDLGINILNGFPFIDIIVCGEGEIPLLNILRELEDNKYLDTNKINTIPNIIYRCNKEIRLNETCTPIEMETLPIPNYDDYFEFSLKNELDIYPKLSIESSRGCFYGLCEFCNLNIQWPIKYRQKSAEKVFFEIKYLTHKYKSLRILFVDSNVTNRTDIFNFLKKDETDYECWAEVSAHLKNGRNDFEEMSLSGIRHIQIGIESFSPRLLKSFRKGVTLMRNIEVLKWCTEFDIDLFYNIIIGYPDENVEDVETTLEVMKYVRYFQPPNITLFMLSIDSPLFKYIKNIGSFNNYRIKEKILNKLSEEHFQMIGPLLSTIVGYEPKNKNDIYTKWDKVISYVQKWIDIYNKNNHKPGLIINNADNFSVVTDTTKEPERQIILQGISRTIYLTCLNEATSFNDIYKAVNCNKTQTKEILTKLMNLEILYGNDDYYLSLAVPIR